MNHRSISRRVVGVLLALSFTAALVGAGPVSAKVAFFFQQHGSFVQTTAGPSCTGGGPYACDAYLLNVFVGREHVVNSGNPAFPDGVYPGDRVCYEIDHWTAAAANPPDYAEISSYEFNCNRTVGQATFDHQTSATLSPTAIAMDHFDCSPPHTYFSDTGCVDVGPAGTVTLSGTWMGTGPISNYHGNDLSKPMPFCFHAVENGKTRDAIWPAGLPFTPDHSMFNEGNLTIKASADLRCV